MAVRPDGTHVYVTNVSSSSGSVSVIDVATNTVTDTIGVGSGPLGVAFANCPVPGGGGYGYVEPAVPVCVEDEWVQTDPALASAGVGAEDRDNGVLYRVTTGAGCSFNCLDRFDINCDGKLGAR